MKQFYGNDTLKTTLASHLRGGRLPHALLLEGEAGCGKKTFARLVATAAVCEGPVQERPCGACKHCRKAAQGWHPDIVLYDGGASAKTLGVDAIRQIRSDASVRPNEARRKVYILADAQAMTAQAQNALLKVLEEPPGGVMFLLTCENRSQLLETIVSRSVAWRVQPVSQEACLSALRELAPDADEAQRRLAAQIFGGNIGKALASLQEGGFARMLEACDRAARAAATGTQYDLIRELAVFEGDKDGFSACLKRLEALFLEALRDKYRRDPGEAAEADGFRLEESISALQCRQMIDIIREASRLLAQNVGYPLVSSFLAANLKNPGEWKGP